MFPAASVKPETHFFAANERTWMRRKWEIIRDAQRQADKAINQWRLLSDEVIDYLDRSSITDPVQRARIKGENLRLTDLFTLGQWYRNEARAHMEDLNLFLRLKEMGIV